MAAGAAVAMAAAVGAVLVQWRGGGSSGGAAAAAAEGQWWCGALVGLHIPDSLVEVPLAVSKQCCRTGAKSQRLVTLVAKAQCSAAAVQVCTRTHPNNKAP